MSRSSTRKRRTENRLRRFLGFRLDSPLLANPSPLDTIEDMSPGSRGVNLTAGAIRPRLHVGAAPSAPPPPDPPRGGILAPFRDGSPVQPVALVSSPPAGAVAQHVGGRPSPRP